MIMHPISRKMLGICPVCLIAGVLFVGSGCDLISMLQNQKKLVEREIKLMSAKIQDTDWKAVKRYRAKGFIWETSAGFKIGPTRQGKERGWTAYVKSLTDVPHHNAFSTKVLSIDKVDDATYVAHVECRLRIVKGTDSYDTIIWGQAQRWIKGKEKWRLKKIKDKDVKKGWKGQNFNTNP
jgi:hypothetical protein